MEKESWIDFDSIPIISQIKKLPDSTHDGYTTLALGKITFSRMFDVEVDEL
jgi:hypothetical protein